MLGKLAVKNFSFCVCHSHEANSPLCSAVVTLAVMEQLFNIFLEIKSETKKRAYIQKLVICKKSSFFVQSSWKFVELIALWDIFFT